MTTSFDATYSVEDNKLRIYASSRLDKDLYNRFKEMGFRWAPKQELFVAPMWTPSREDFCLELAGEITAEQTTLVERAQAKAERLDGYAEKAEARSNAFYQAANNISKRFEFGQPILVGHHSERKARKDQQRMHSAMDSVVKNTKMIDYWNYKAQGVERHANYKLSPGVIGRRIKTLLKDLRDKQRQVNHAHICLTLWEKVGKIAEPDKLKEMVEYYNGAQLPTGAASPYGFYSKLSNGEMTHQEVIDSCIELNTRIVHSESIARWINHILNRLAFETSELGDVERFGGDLTATIIKAFARTHGAHKPEVAREENNWVLSSSVPLPLHIAGGERVLLSDDEMRDLMQGAGYVVPVTKARKHSNRGPSVPLINPTLEEVERLQTLWNSDMEAQCQKKGYAAKVAGFREVEQSVFSANSKGDYAPFKTVELDSDGRRIWQTWRNYELVKTGEPVCRIRIYTGGGDFHRADSVVFLKDKPCKKLPIVWVEKLEAAVK